MPITRAQLLRRALVGGVVIAFGELPELASKIPEAQAAPVLTRTAIPTTARMCRFEWLEDEMMPGMVDSGTTRGLKQGWVPLRSTPQESGETAWRVGAADPNLVLLSAQKVQWEETIKGYPPMVMGEHLRKAAVLPPQAGKHFTTDDIVRSSHDGDCYLVRGKLAPDTLELQYVGFTKDDDPLIDPRAEARALQDLMPDPKDEITPELAQKFHQHALGGRPLSKDEMRSFEQYAQSPDGRRRGYDRW